MSAVVVQRHRFSVDEYHRMGEAGLFVEDDRIELIEGERLDSERLPACGLDLSEVFAGL